ncbi:methylated-DNA--[protein]-cysteine S-methyltransferase [Algoriphagus algorifonticola]|uniref:methylated-DNA--[protein]-cysteine S-methyltransferase n=1 Tax=Algoriphagus algorifonticola TaxID=2593007 RepID=UPI0011A82949|nr:methylated-DNA--[protein]-cysteine S-methyltransferase [Algoriphagus algorifonticola]
MRTIITQTYQSPVGELLLGVFEDQLCLCDWKYRKMRQTIDQRIQSGLNAAYQEGSHPVLEKAVVQLNEYFNSERKTFELPLHFVGSDFQKSVWNALAHIPFGETKSYLALSQQLQNPDAIRAVASANGANAISIIVPCHRIIGSDGNLVGYAGGLEAKKKLLRLEGIQQFSKPGQIQLFN